MRVHGVCYYRSKSDTWTEKWRDVDFKARNIVQAVKRKPFNGFSILEGASRVFRIDDTQSGRQIALRYAAAQIAKKIGEAGYHNVAVIPVPSSSHTVLGQDFTGARLAAAIEAANHRLQARPILYFNTPQPKSAAGGGRNPHAIKHAMRVSPEVDEIDVAVLLDDVMTSGAHFKAAAWLLEEHGLTINDAFVVGRTAWDKPERMFRVQPEDLCC